jgi:hypothetical protein
MVFLAAGALSSVLVGTLAERPGAWPVGGVFAALFLIYTAAVVEADRRKTARRIAARRAAREAAARALENEYAEAV